MTTSCSEKLSHSFAIRGRWKAWYASVVGRFARERSGRKVIHAADQPRNSLQATDAAPLPEAAAVTLPLRPLSLRLNFSWVLVGNVARAACRYGTLLLIGYFCGLTVAGEYAIAMALCTPLWAFVMLGLRGALVTDARREYSFADYLAVRLIASGIGGLVVVGIVLLGAYDARAATAILLVAAARLLEGISDILRARLQQQERMDRIAIALGIQGVGGLALISLIGSLGGSATLVLAALPIAMALTLLLWDVPCYAEMACMAPGEGHAEGSLWRKPLHWSTLGRLSLVAFPLAVVGGLIAFVPQLPKYVIASVSGQEAVAAYTIVAYGITLGMMVVMALGNAAAPRLAKNYAAGDVRRFTRLVIQLVVLVAGIGAAGLGAAMLWADEIAILFGTLSPEALRVLHQENVRLPHLMIALSLFAMMFYVTAPLGRALAAMRKFWSQAISMALGLAAAALIMPWAVRLRGMVGAAEAMALCMAIVAALSAGLVWRELSRLARQQNEPAKEAAAPVV